MPLTVSPIKKAIVKRALKQGKSARQALKEANYAPSAIRQSTYNPVVKQSIAEITEEYKVADITPEWIKKNYILIQELALREFKGKKKNAKFLSIHKETNDSLAKILQMFNDNQANITNIISTGQQKQARIDRLKSLLPQEDSK